MWFKGWVVKLQRTQQTPPIRINGHTSGRYTTQSKLLLNLTTVHRAMTVAVAYLSTQELNPSAQRCLIRLFTGDFAS
jgi:hypothetical protein